ncbi:hypothetical protein D3C77_268270 [compost metagenome]
MDIGLCMLFLSAAVYLEILWFRCIRRASFDAVNRYSCTCGSCVICRQRISILYPGYG